MLKSDPIFQSALKEATSMEYTEKLITEIPDKWYKRLFTKLMWKLRIWHPPESGHGVYKEQGIQVKEFEPITRVSDAMRGTKESGLEYSKKIDAAIEFGENGITTDWIDNIIQYCKLKGITYKTTMMVPFGVKCPDAVKFYAFGKGIKIVNNGEL